MAGFYLTCYFIFQVSVLFTQGAVGTSPARVILLSGESGVFQFPAEGEREYPNDAKVLWQLNIPAGKQAVNLIFISFKTEENYDKLVVYTTEQGSEKILEQYTGDRGNFNESFVLSSNLLQFRFTSDSSVTEDGFKISYTLVDCPQGTWGQGCRANCSVNCASTCKVKDGACTCIPGYTGSLCTEQCQKGKWGQGCKNSCSAHCATPCKKSDGSCSCKPGYRGRRCSEVIKPMALSVTMPATEVSFTTGLAVCHYGRGCENPCAKGCANSCNQISGECSCRPGYKGSKCDGTCDPGSWGWNCQNRCSPNCATPRVCSSDDGKCAKGCQPGYIGPDCSVPCPAGTFGTRCESRCAQGCKNTCNSSSGECMCRPGFKGATCETECAAGEWGQDCLRKCPVNCDQTLPCDKTDGSCSCKPGFHGNTCTQECPGKTWGLDCRNNCSDGCSADCKKTDGSCKCKPGYSGSRCINVCRLGYYGKNCKMQCASGCEDPCYHVTGSCTCRPGFTGSSCRKRCNQGTWGRNCIKNCNVKCGGTGSCSVEHGRCIHGCKPGYLGSHCNITCPAGTFGSECKLQCATGCRDTCNSLTGACQCRPGFKGPTCDTVCEAGTWGTNCLKKCPANCDNSTACDSSDGSCICKPGFQGVKCQLACKSGTYGSWCAARCSPGCKGSCNHVTGTCNCKAGYSGPLCDKEGARDEGKLHMNMLYATTGTSIFFFIILAMCFLTRISPNKSKSTVTKKGLELKSKVKEKIKGIKDKQTHKKTSTSKDKGATKSDAKQTMMIRQSGTSTDYGAKFNHIQTTPMRPYQHQGTSISPSDQQTWAGPHPDFYQLRQMLPATPTRYTMQ